MEKLAIIGTGISGMGAAYRLRGRYDIHMFDGAAYAGGHTNTIHVIEETASGERSLPVDTGFIVFNETTYPHLTRLFRDLQVESGESDMSFGMHNHDIGLQFCGKSLNHLFAQRKNLLSPRYWKFLVQANRFNTTAPADLADLSAEEALYDYLGRRGYNEFFVNNYVIPMGSAVWSTPIDKMLSFPARSFIRFFHNHGFLGLHTQLQWRYVKGGSNTYTHRIIEVVRPDLHLNEAVRRVSRLSGGGASVQTDHGEYEFDRVILACHADQSLRMLDSPTELEQELLSRFKYENNRAVLHTDISVMPPLKRVWSAWNYKTRSDGEETATVYHMNPLQKLPTDRDYFVSINDFETIRESAIIREIDYSHPLFDAGAMQVQKDLYRLNESGPIYFCGSYFGYGFHEDGLRSAVALTDHMMNPRASLELAHP